ncbi:MAG: hypothetical protein AAB774_02620 [Patescibacteria group bacterium]
MSDVIRREPIGIGSSAEYRVKFEDKTSFSTKSIEEVVTDENLPGRRIKELMLYASIPGKEIKIEFGSTVKKKDEQQYRDYITITVKGPDRQWVFVTLSIVEDIIKSVKEARLRGWYFVLPALVATVYMGTRFLHLILDKFAFYHREWNRSGDIVTVGPTLDILIIILLGVAVGVFLSKLLPNIVFLFGKEVSAHDHRRKLQSQVLWSLLIALLVSLLSNIIAKNW